MRELPLLSLAMTLMACGSTERCEGRTPATIPMPSQLDGGVLPVGAPAALHVAIPGRYECPQDGGSTPSFVNASSARVEAYDPSNQSVAAQATLDRRLGQGPAGTGDAQIDFTPGSAGPYHFTVHFEPSFGTVQIDLLAQ
jgi:hypothetical protein